MTFSEYIIKRDKIAELKTQLNHLDKEQSELEIIEGSFPRPLTKIEINFNDKRRLIYSEITNLNIDIGLYLGPPKEYKLSYFGFVLYPDDSRLNLGDYNDSETT